MKTIKLIIKSLFTYIFNFGNTKKIVDNINKENIKELKNNNKIPTILIHGNFQNYHSFMIEVLKWFKKNDLLVISVGYDYKESLEKSVIKVKKQIEDILQKTNSKKINIIALSYGGIVARTYIEKYEGYKKVNKLVTICTPYFPVNKYSLGFFLNWLVGGHGKEDNKTLKELLTKNSIKNHLAICAKNDLIIGNKKIDLKNTKFVKVKGFHHPLSQNTKKLEIALTYIKKN